jgi:hypothetical protein
VTSTVRISDYDNDNDNDNENDNENDNDNDNEGYGGEISGARALRPPNDTRAMQILDRLHALARRLAWLRPALAAAGIVLFALAATLVVFGDPQSGDGVLLPAIAGGLWCLCAWLFIDTLAAVPPAPGPNEHGWRRLRRQLARLWYLLLALALLGITFAVLSLSQRLIGEAFG